MAIQEKAEIVFGKYKEKGAYHWRTYFGRILQTDSFLRARYDLVINQLQKYGLSPSSKVLEIGCGDGALCGLLYKKFKYEITGIDPSSEGIQYCQEQFKLLNYKGSFRVCEGYDFPFETGSFDAILCCDVIEHLQQPEAMVSEIHRLLKPKGLAIMTTPVRTNEYPTDKFHVMEFFPDQLVDLCRKSFGTPYKRLLTHPVIWFELYIHTRNPLRAIVKTYCRIKDKIFGSNVFLQSNENSTWKNFKMQCLVLVKD